MAFIGGKKPETGPGGVGSRTGSPETLTQPVSRPSGSVVAGGKGGPSLVGMDLMINGNLSSDGEIHIEGEVQGDIKCASLIVGDNARVTGEVVAEDVVIRGNMMGTIKGMRVTLQSSSHVEGDIFHKSLAIEQGAFFEGKSRRSDDPTAVTSDSSSSSKKPAASGSVITPAKPVSTIN